MWYIYAALMISILSMLVLQTSDYNSRKSIDATKSYQGTKNLAEADSQNELGALQNKRFYQNGDSSKLSRDLQFMTEQQLKDFIKGSSESEYSDYGDNNGLKATYANSQKATDYNIDNTTRRLSMDDDSDVLNSYENNNYDVPINSNIKFISDNTDEQFSKIRIRWGDKNQSEKIQVTLYRFPVNQSVGLDRTALLENFKTTGKSQGQAIAKKIYQATGNSSSILDTSYSNNPQYDFFNSVVEFGDFIGGTDLKPKEYLYFLNIESLSSNPVPILIEAFNSKGDPVGFVGDYKISYDSTGLGGGTDRKRVQLVQTIGYSRMKYYNKSIFGGSNLSKDVVE